MAVGAGRFRRSDRLLRAKDFQRVARLGKRYAAKGFVVLVAPAWRRSHDERPIRRLGVTASRKVGGAVVRNRVKRSVREWFRSRRGRLAADVDVVVIARRDCAELAPLEIHAKLDEAMRFEASDVSRSAP